MHPEKQVVATSNLSHVGPGKSSGLTQMPINVTSTPAVANRLTVNGNTSNTIANASASTMNGNHSPSLLPVTLQWLGQNPNLLGKFMEYYKREQFCDCIIWSQEKCFRAHRIILAACSGFFRRIFLKVEGAEPSPTNVVLNESVSATDVSQVLDIIYKGSVDAHREVQTPF